MTKEREGTGAAKVERKGLNLVVYVWSPSSLPRSEPGMYQSQPSVEAIERMVDIHEKKAKCMKGLGNQQYKSVLTLPCLSLKFRFLGEILLNIQTLWKHLSVW